MTKEEAKKYIRSKMCNDCGVYLCGGNCSDNCKVIEAIESLEQDVVPFDFELYQQGLMAMPKGMIEVLTKIRAEIESVIQEETVMVHSEARNGYERIVAKLDPDDVFQIIDKYKRD